MRANMKKKYIIAPQSMNNPNRDDVVFDASTFLCVDFGQFSFFFFTMSILGVIALIFLSSIQ